MRTLRDGAVAPQIRVYSKRVISFTEYGRNWSSETKGTVTNFELIKMCLDTYNKSKSKKITVVRTYFPEKSKRYAQRLVVMPMHIVTPISWSYKHDIPKLPTRHIYIP